MNKIKYPLVCFDLDGTLLQDTVFIWSNLHEHFRTDEEVRTRAKEDFFSGRISYREWFFTDIDLLARAGADLQSMTSLIDGLSVTPGSHETIAVLKKAGARIAVISGSIDLALNRHFKQGVFDHVLINRVFFDDEGALTGGEPTRYDLERKADGLRALARRETVRLSETVYVGDNYNDVPAARTAGLSIAFNCRSDELRAAADVIIESNNLRSILEHLL